MSRRYRIYFMLVACLALLSFSAAIADDQAPGQGPPEEIDPDGLEGITWGIQWQSGVESGGRGGDDQGAPGARLIIRSLLRVARSFGF